MLKYNQISLNGDWYMQYLGKAPYESNSLPEINNEYLIEGAIPAYWEDMSDKFRDCPIHPELNYNPSYTRQRYTQTGYVPDMVLPNVLGTFSYRRKITLNKESLKGELELYIGGAQNAVCAWINGAFIGKHEGYSSDFAFPISVDTLKDGENEIVLDVSKEYLKGYKGRVVSGLTNRAANEYTGGIYGDVELRAYANDITM